MIQVKIICVLVLIGLTNSALIREKRQQQGINFGDSANNNNQNQRPTTPRQRTTTTPPQGTTTTTPSPAFSNCFRSCPATPEYNPVCGSNRITYDNANKLNCANRCGLNIRVSFGGTCAPVT